MKNWKTKNGYKKNQRKEGRKEGRREGRKEGRQKNTRVREKKRECVGDGSEPFLSVANQNMGKKKAWHVYRLKL